MKKNLIVWIMLALSIIGFINATYLAIKVMIGGPIVCYVFSGCDIVTQSSYSKLFGVPFSAIGSLFYAAMIIVITYYLQRQTKRARIGVICGGLFGGLFSLYFFSLQAFVIDAWCFYCVISGTIGTINALLAAYLVRSVIWE